MPPQEHRHLYHHPKDARSYHAARRCRHRSTEGTTGTTYDRHYIHDRTTVTTDTGGHVVHVGARPQDEHEEEEDDYDQLTTYATEEAEAIPRWREGGEEEKGAEANYNAGNRSHTAMELDPGSRM